MTTTTTENPAELTLEAYLARPFAPIFLDDHENAIEAMGNGIGPTLLGDEIKPLPSLHYVGRHAVCGGGLRRIRSSRTHDVLLCDECCFRH
jgi:hypothetical protein